jgi:hypothetical protein
VQCSPISTTDPIFGMSIRPSGARSHSSGKVRHAKACGRSAIAACLKQPAKCGGETPPVGQRAARSLLERWPAVLVAGKTWYDAAQGHWLALEGAATRLPLSIGGKREAGMDAKTRAAWSCSPH